MENIQLTIHPEHCGSLGKQNVYIKQSALEPSVSKNEKCKNLTR